MRETITNQTEHPRIYVACLAAYNNGILHGAWIDAAQEPWALWDEVSAILAASPIAGAEEWAIHDYEGFGGVRIEEYTSLDLVAVKRRSKGTPDRRRRGTPFSDNMMLVC